MRRSPPRSLPSSARARARAEHAGSFQSWCEALGVPWLPARPNTVALFVLEGAKLGIEQMLECIHSISVSHQAAQLADPTSGFPVTSALNTISKIEPPRSWAES